MAEESLLAFLAARIAPSAENVATEALGFLLRRSEVAREVLAQLAKDAGAIVPIDAKYRTQATDEKGNRPDLVGEVDGRGRVIVIEAKFWAGLTGAQPNEYLKQVAEGGLLLFVAPAARTEVLKAEVLRRCRTKHPEAVSSGDRVEVMRKTISVVSWGKLLKRINDNLPSADASLRSDVNQLQSLCDRMDSEAFLPLTDEELASSAGRRVIDFGKLADDLVARMTAEDPDSRKGLRTTAANGRYGRFFLIHGYGCCVLFSARRWASWGSPLVLRVKGPDWKPSEKAADALKKAGLACLPGGVGYDIPIRLLTGVERETVVDHAYDQLVDAARVLETIKVTVGTGSPQPEDPISSDAEET